VTDGTAPQQLLLQAAGLRCNTLGQRFNRRVVPRLVAVLPERRADVAPTVASPHPVRACVGRACAVLRYDSGMPADGLRALRTAGGGMALGRTGTALGRTGMALGRTGVALGERTDCTARTEDRRLVLLVQSTVSAALGSASLIDGTVRMRPAVQCGWYGQAGDCATPRCTLQTAQVPGDRRPLAWHWAALAWHWAALAWHWAALHAADCVYQAIDALPFKHAEHTRCADRRH
jgi:hypothetical protein